MAKPLSKLTGNEPWQWEQEQQTGFEQLIEAFGKEPILMMVQAEGKYKIETDASGFACRGVLYQKQDNHWCTIAFYSTSMTKTERNYRVEDRELLAIILALMDWRHYLMGARETFEIWSDHSNLQYFRQPQKVNRQHAGWITVWSEYDYTLHHLPGVKNSRADSLS
jgi:hypothetical protein